MASELLRPREAMPFLPTLLSMDCRSVMSSACVCVRVRWKGEEQEVSRLCSGLCTCVRSAACACV